MFVSSGYPDFRVEIGEALKPFEVPTDNVNIGTSF
jgi:hypothetical protein